MKNKITALILLFTLLISYSPLIIKPQTAEAAGEWVWEELTGAGLRFWRGITSSADGTKLAATALGSYIYTSSDSGATWAASTDAGSRNWWAITSSDDGTKLAAAVGGSSGDRYIYTSTDSGETWTEQTDSGSRSWDSITSSADGTKIAAVVQGGYIYTSADSGATWATSTDAGSRSWRGITSSADGTKLAAVVQGGYIYTSADSGATWATSTDAGSRNWWAITSSDDGTKLAATGAGEYIYTSSDSGATWTQQTSAGLRSWQAITLSADGTKLAAGVNGGYIHTLSDSGATWTEQISAGARSWRSITSSADGTKLVAVGHSNYIYRGTFTLPSHTLSFNTQGASPIPDITEDEGTSVTLPPSPTYEGYTFLNWNTQADGEGDSYQPGDSFTLNSDTTLYAIWEENPIEEQPEEQTPSEEPSRRSSSRSVPSSLQAKNNTLNSIVLQYKDSLTTLHTLGIISLPQNILDILNIQTTNTTTNIPVRNLELGMTGQDVISLQKLLNSNGYIITTSGTGSLGNETEFFGALTQSALARYQATNGISPASGYFGPLTRTQMKNANLEGVWW